MPKIKKILAKEILDSRGNPTIETTIFSKNNKATASVPSGASTGKKEAKELRDNGKRYQGKGVLKAIKNIEGPIAKRLIGRDSEEQEFIDEALIHLDGTENKTRLGANAILAVSMACLKLTAKENELPLFKQIMNTYKLKEARIPRPFFNIINGGKHAGNGLAIQEYMITPNAKKFSESLQKGTEIYHTLKNILEKKYGKQATNVGDEGGFAPTIKNIEIPLKEIQQASKKCGYEKETKYAIDAAATSFYKKPNYIINEETKTKEWLIKWYENMIKKYPLISIEDPLQEEDFKGFSEITKNIGSKVQIVGDDLLCTNLKLIKKAIEEKSCNTLLLKINQIGTITEAIRSAKLAEQNKWKIMVSHRSGETNENFIAHLAVALGCGEIKAGAPCRGERLAKYNELLRIEEDHKIKF